MYLTKICEKNTIVPNVECLHVQSESVHVYMQDLNATCTFINMYFYTINYISYKLSYTCTFINIFKIIGAGFEVYLTLE